MATTTPTNSAEQAPPPNPICGRRTVLRAVGLVALGGGTTAILAACSVEAGTSSPATSSAPSQQTSPSAAESASATPSASESATSDASPAPEGTEVPISDVPVGGGVVVEKKYVVTQPTDGDFKVFSAICTHQQNPVGEVTDKQIVCNFHQSHFSITDGSVVSGPAQSALPAVAFVKSGDNIVITG